MTQNNQGLIADTQALIEDAENLLQATQGKTDKNSNDTRTRVQATIGKMKADLGDLQKNAVAKAKVAGKATDEYVQSNPWKAIGIAAGAGLLIGLLTSRR